MKRNIVLSIASGIATAVLLWLSLEASDAIFQSRLLPWVLPLIYLQDAGFSVAAHFFPCQKEGFDSGCEMYKTIPAFLGTNALLYSTVSFPLIGFLQMKVLAKGLPSPIMWRVLPRNLRLLAGATGCVTGIALLGLSETLSVAAILLIVGAMVVGWLPRTGRWLILAPALFVTVMVLPVGSYNLFEAVREGRFQGPHDFAGIVMSLSWLLSPILLIWCDTALLIDATKEMRTRVLD